MAGIFKKNFIQDIDPVKSMILDHSEQGLIAANDLGDIMYSNKLGEAIMDAGAFGPIDIVSKKVRTIDYNGKKYVAKYERLADDSLNYGVLAILTDTIGDDEKAKEIADLKVELDHANAFKSNFLANMSHEIRTPIHAIIGFAEMMIKENIPDSAKDEAELIKDSSYSLLAIINDVLDLSKLEAGKMELVNSNYYISYIIRDIEATYNMLSTRKGIKFNMHLDSSIPSCLYGDKIRLRGVLFNILNNAVKFTVEGQIDFNIRVLSKKDGIVTFQFEVKDTGIGIKKEALQKIFEPFSKFDVGDSYAEGRGLGLSIAKGFLDLMGGTISVKSEYGVGSTFTIVVDQKIVDDSPLDMNIVNARKKKSKDKFTIHDINSLVVDDNPVNLTVADGLMKSYGLTADRATGGREAIEKCMAKNYDIIFMDQMMPEVDGIMAMKEIRKISDFYAEKSIIIVLTADAMAGVRDRLMKEGFDEYLCKPLEISRLDGMLRKFIPEENVTIIDENNKNANSNPKEEVKENVKASKSEVASKPTESPKAVKAAKEDDKSVEEVLSDKLGVSKDVILKKVSESKDGISEYKELCKNFVDGILSKTEKLRESLDGKDYDRYAVEVHGLKSQLLSLGAMDLHEMAKEQENAVNDSKFEFVEKHMEDFIKGYEGLVEKIKKYVMVDEDIEKKASDDGSALGESVAVESTAGNDIAKESVSEAKDTEAKVWSKDEITAMARKIGGKIEEYDFEGLFGLMDEYSNMPMDENTREVFNKIKESIDNMDMDEARQRLGELS